MADTKITDLTAGSALVGTEEVYTNVAGADRKHTLAQIRTYAGSLTAPTFVSVSGSGFPFASTGVPTAQLPGTHTTNDILVLVLQSSNQDIPTPGGYTRVGPQNGLGDAAVAGANRLGIFWKRDNGSESAPTLTDTGDHTMGFMFAIRGCPTTGDPFEFGGNNWKFTASTSATGPKSVTYCDNTLVVDIWAGSDDAAGQHGSSLTNADLSSLTEQFDYGDASGTGGFFYLSSGLKAVAGPVGATTVTWSANSVDLCTRLHFVPADRYDPESATRGPDIQIFIGSSSDTDDTWVKPTGARKVFVQLCDGGGSGSSGNTTTTAAGGGGGGGGGYDEAWYEANDLGATVTVHAGKGGAATTALNQAGNPGVLSEFDKGNRGPLTSTSRIAGTAATAAASADGGNGGCGSGRGTGASIVVQTTRRALTGANAACASGGLGAAGGSGTTAPTGGSEGDWGGGGGESGGDTDAAITSANNGNSMRGAGGGAGGRTNTNVSGSGAGGGAAGVSSANGASGTDSARIPYGGSGGCGGGSGTVTGGPGGFPGGGGGGGAGAAGGFGGRGGHGCVVVTTFF